MRHLECREQSTTAFLRKLAYKGHHFSQAQITCLEMSLINGQNYTLGTVIAPGQLIDLLADDQTTVTLQAHAGGGNYNQQWTALQDSGNPLHWSFQNVQFPGRFLGLAGQAVLNTELQGVVGPVWFTLNFNTAKQLRLDAAPGAVVQVDRGVVANNTPLVLEAVVGSGPLMKAQRWVPVAV